jgi:hypothetical protein
MGSPPLVVDWIGGLLRELALWGGVLLLLVGALSLYMGWQQRQRSSLVDETPRSDVAAVDAPGTVRVRGNIEPRTDTFTAPITGDRNCVLSAWEIEEMYDTPKTRSWEKSAWGVRAVPFYVSDGTGRLLVDVDDEVVGNETSDVFTPETLVVSTGVSVEGLQCAFESFEHHVETGYGESPPRRVERFVRNTDGLSTGPMVTDLGGYVVDESKRRYLEQTLQPGDEVSVIGHASARRDAGATTDRPDNLVLTQAADTALRLSERPFDEMADGRGALVFGVLAGAVGVALLAARFLL